MSILDGVTEVLFAHAHPDDETLTTGALIARLRRSGVGTAVLTATRGERGEVVLGPLTQLAGTDELAAERERELAAALEVLGVDEHCYLGTPPARARGLPPRRYRDSGMRWITASVAGPASDTDPRSLTSAPFEEVVADLVAWTEQVHPDLLICDDNTGGYGHPDHVRIHHACVAAAEQTGIRLAEVLSDGASPDERVEWLQLDGEFPAVIAALDCHASQLTVDGSDVVHSGGQRKPIVTTTGLRLVSPGAGA